MILKHENLLFSNLGTVDANPVMSAPIIQRFTADGIAISNKINNPLTTKPKVTQFIRTSALLDRATAPVSTIDALSTKHISKKFIITKRPLQNKNDTKLHETKSQKKRISLDSENTVANIDLEDVLKDSTTKRLREYFCLTWLQWKY